MNSELYRTEVLCQFVKIFSNLCLYEEGADKDSTEFVRHTDHDCIEKLKRMNNDKCSLILCCFSSAVD